MIKVRHISRLVAIQAVYQAQIKEISCSEAFDNVNEIINYCKEDYFSSDYENIIMPEVIDLYNNNIDLIGEFQLYAQELIFGIDEKINIFKEFLSTNDKSRVVSRIDFPILSILLVAMYEMDYIKDLDYKISMNEAIEFCKTFSDIESSKYVNSVLQAFLDK